MKALILSAVLALGIFGGSAVASADKGITQPSDVCSGICPLPPCDSSICIGPVVMPAPAPMCIVVGKSVYCY